MVRAWVVVIVALFPVLSWAQPEPADVAVEPPPVVEANKLPARGTLGPRSDASALRADTPSVDRPRVPDGWRLMLANLTILRLNPVGLETRARFGLQNKLYPSTKPISENNFMFVGLFPKLNPVSAQLAIGGEIQPASIFNLRVFGEVQKYFGNLGYLQSFSSANANYSDETLADIKDMPTPATEPEAALVKHLAIQPMVQLKVGKIAVRTLWMLDYWAFDTRDTTAYDATLDTLLPDNGWTLSTDTDVLYVPGNGLAAGLRHSWVHPFYGSEHFMNAPDEAAYDGDNAHQRIGLFGAFTFKDHGPSTFNKPTAILIVSMYLSHKYRAGEPGTLPPGHDAGDYHTRAFPYLLAGFAFESDFLAVD